MYVSAILNEITILWTDVENKTRSARDCSSRDDIQRTFRP
jgi:hypothetical protein